MLDLSELSCTKCQELFKISDRRPRLLPECEHTSCSHCISLLISKRSTKNGFKCPEDGMTCGINKQNCEQFPKNLSLLRILEKQLPNTKIEAENMCLVHKKMLEIVWKCN